MSYDRNALTVYKSVYKHGLEKRPFVLRKVGDRVRHPSGNKAAHSGAPGSPPLIQSSRGEQIRLMPKQHYTNP